jgi:UDP-N-acetylmuramoylalanine--D-glutamate ligase
MKFTDLISAKKISIAGYGAEGKAAEQFCKTHCPAIPLSIVDPISSAVTDDGSVWIISPGISRDFFKNISKERVTSGTEIFFDSLSEEERQKVIGISGTKGKSTTTKFCTEALIAAGKKAVAAGNFGVPLLDVFDALKEGTVDFVVAELSSYQLENLETSPGLAIFLNIFPDHLDRHGSFVSYQQAKENLFRHQKKGDFLFVPNERRDDFQTAATVIRSNSLNPELFPPNSSFRADHWCQNFGVVEKMFKTLRLPLSAIEKTAALFLGLPHRLEHFSSAHNRMWWDDAICTNPEAAMATVRFFGKQLGALVLGGQDRGMDVSPLAQCLKQYAPQAVVLVLQSEAGERFLSAIPWAERIFDFDTAVSVIVEQTPVGTNAVLCPAAPSYDQFKNFKEKGDAWQRAVFQSSN